MSKNNTVRLARKLQSLSAEPYQKCLEVVAVALRNGSISSNSSDDALLGLLVKTTEWVTNTLGFEEDILRGKVLVIGEGHGRLRVLDGLLRSLMPLAVQRPLVIVEDLSAGYDEVYMSTKTVAMKYGLSHQRMDIHNKVYTQGNGRARGVEAAVMAAVGPFDDAYYAHLTKDIVQGAEVEETGILYEDLKAVRDTLQERLEVSKGKLGVAALSTANAVEARIQYVMKNMETLGMTEVSFGAQVLHVWTMENSYPLLSKVLQAYALAQVQKGMLITNRVSKDLSSELSKAVDKSEMAVVGCSGDEGWPELMKRTRTLLVGSLYDKEAKAARQLLRVDEPFDDFYEYQSSEFYMMSRYRPDGRLHLAQEAREDYLGELRIAVRRLIGTVGKDWLTFINKLDTDVSIALLRAISGTEERGNAFESEDELQALRRGAVSCFGEKMNSFFSADFWDLPLKSQQAIRMAGCVPQDGVRSTVVWEDSAARVAVGKRVKEMLIELERKSKGD